MIEKCNEITGVWREEVGVGVCGVGRVTSVCDTLIRWGFSGRVRKPSRLWRGEGRAGGR